MKRADRTTEQKAVDRVMAHAMALYHNCKGSELERGKGLIGKLLRACNRLNSVKSRKRKARANQERGA